ncbi:MULTISPECIES: polysaccharide pyruvyl transferase family protein [unclassified Rhizobium]|uniref:polysaccharide pyruvyl transferase family protein n=1 Tax=unclassified Rhizobium TaxID=2613769 RepID=UPI0009EA550C|nr:MULTISPECIES: polysaccharide pyruvyl transferase family protein [unclassified Rhizobium]
MKISLFGQFGSGNTGNDGSLESMILFLRKLRPDAELQCICSNPKVVQARYGIPAKSVGGPAPSSLFARTLNKVLFNLPRRVILLFSALGQFNDIDLMIVPGTGILDDFQDRVLGWPLVLFCWCLAARLRNTRIAFVSIGAGPVHGRLSRLLLVSAARMATYRSYRDEASLRFMTSVGIDVANDHRYPDIAFGLPSPPIVPRQAAWREASESAACSDAPLTFGVGIMQYRGWRHHDPKADDIYADYIAKMSDFVGRLAADGHRVCLFMGDVTDERARDDIRNGLAGTLSAEQRSRIEAHSGKTLQDVMALVAGVDITVVSRYHNLVCSLKLGRPSISLGYAQKNDDLMQRFGQQAYSRHIERFDTEELLVLVRRLIADRQGATEAIAQTNAGVRAQLADQENLLYRTLLSMPAPLAAPDLPERPTGSAPPGGETSLLH